MVELSKDNGEILFRQLDERASEADPGRKLRDDLENMAEADRIEYLSEIVSMHINIFQAASLNKLLPSEYRLLCDDEME